MSEATIGALESEAAYEGEGTGEAAYEGEWTGEASYEGEGTGEAAYEVLGEDARSDARRRARQQQQQRRQQILLARRAQLRRPPAPPRTAATTGPSPNQAIREVRSLDLDTKMALNSLRREVRESNRRGDRATYSAVLSTIAAQGIDTFGQNLAKHDIVRALLRTPPLLLLSPPKNHSRGVQGVLFHPATFGLAGAAVILFSGHFMNAPKGVQKINIADPGTVSVGDTGALAGVAVDRDGQPHPEIALTWTSQAPDILTITNAATGAYTAGEKAAPVFVTVTGGGATNGIFVTVTD